MMKTKDEKRLVFGDGFLGTKLSEELECKLVKRDEVDAANYFALKKYIEKENPDAIINAIAKIGHPNADWCESNHGPALEANVLIPSNLARLCKEKNIHFTQMSTGCIYNGDNHGKGFKEDDEPNYYGTSFHLTTKILGEKVIEGYPCLIIRLKMPIDEKPHPRNLITKLAGYSKVIDEPNSMTMVPDLMKTMHLLVDRKAVGKYNIVNPGTITAAQIMKMYREEVDPNHSFQVIPFRKLETLAVRSNSYLNTDKLRREGIHLPEIHEAVRDCLKKYKENIK